MLEKIILVASIIHILQKNILIKSKLHKEALLQT